jgi:tRNA A-37 threonylcarbamoyl transferase component Bud32
MDRQSATSGLALPLWRRIDQVCLRFEDDWQAGMRPDPGTFLADFPEAQRGPLLADLLLLEWHYRYQAGESFLPEEYAQRFPGLTHAVAQAWQRRVHSHSSAPETCVPSTCDEEPRPLPIAPALVDWPDYEQVELLGRGGMGEVYKAFDPRLKRWVALKRVRLDRANLKQWARCRVEAEALARLTHPHIVRVYGLAERDGEPVLEMEYVAGCTLEQRLGRDRLPPAEAARLAAILAWAVHAAHDNGIVHRDLKPANVLLGAPVAGNPGNVLGGFPKISDFGLAMLTDGAGDQTLSGTVLGTPGYMSPEQAAGKVREIGPAADVWALGVVLYRCLTGVLPFRGDSGLDTLERVKTQQPRPPREHSPEVPAELEAACLVCLRKAPDERPTAAALAAHLEQLAQMQPRAEIPQAAMRPLRSRRRWWAVAAGLLAVSMLVAGIWLAAGKRGLQTTDVSGAGPDQTGPLELHLRVHHWQHEAGGDIFSAIGNEFEEMHYNDRVVLQAELSRPAHCFLIACNCDGKTDLLWPCDERARGDRDRPPPALAHFQYPPLPSSGPDGQPGKQRALALDDDKAGGLQGFLVVASRKPLQPYRTWADLRGAIPWQRLPPSPGVWRSNGETLDTMKLGGVRVRGSVVELEGQPPLLQLCGWARGPDVEVVEALAFPVYPRRD